jgi:drug/metabolite transporter (DMT)-like permease
MIYDVRWLYGVYGRFQLLFSTQSADVPLWRIIVDYVATGIIGDGLRLVGVILALVGLYLLWGPKPKPFFNVKKIITVAVLCEAIYWLTVLPLSIIEIFLGRAPFVITAFVIQILVTAPLLLLLALKIWRFTGPDTSSLVKWGSIAALGYLVGIWFNNVFRWFSMAQATNIGFLFTGTTSIGFLGALITLTLALAFSVTAFYAYFKKRNPKLAIRLAAGALIMLSLNFVLFIIYSALTNTLNYVILVEIWPITVMGLGLGMLRGKI